MPPGKQHVQMFEQRFAYRFPWSTPINHGLEIPTYMREAQLALAPGITIIHFGAITGEDAAIPFAHQLPQRGRTPAGGNREHTELRGDQRPQHAPLPPLLPGRLIYVEIATLHVDG